MRGRQPHACATGPIVLHTRLILIAFQITWRYGCKESKKCWPLLSLADDPPVYCLSAGLDAGRLTLQPGRGHCSCHLYHVVNMSSR